MTDAGNTMHESVTIEKRTPTVFAVPGGALTIKGEQNGKKLSMTVIPSFHPDYTTPVFVPEPQHEWAMDKIKSMFAVATRKTDVPDSEPASNVKIIEQAQLIEKLEKKVAAQKTAMDTMRDALMTSFHPLKGEEKKAVADTVKKVVADHTDAKGDIDKTTLRNVLASSNITLPINIGNKNIPEWLTEAYALQERQNKIIKSLISE